MNVRTIEIEAESLEKAREQLKSQIPENLHMLSEDVISDGNPRTIQAVADTTEEAFLKARDEIPSNAEILEKKVLHGAGRAVMRIEAFSEQAARMSAQIRATNQLRNDAVVDRFELTVAGTKGFLGIGKKPSQYEAELFRPARVEITYKIKARISATIGVSVEALIDDLKSSDESTRTASIEALTEVGEPGVDLLITALRDENEEVRQAAAEVLERIGAPAIEPLHAAARESQTEPVFASVLGRIGAPAVDALIAIFESEWAFSDVQRTAAMSLAEVDAVRAVTMLTSALRRAKGISKPYSKEESLAIKAAQALGEIGDARAVEPLIQVIEDDEFDMEVRYNAVNALANLRDRRALEPLTRSLYKGELNVSWRAGVALAKIDASQAVETLTTALGDPNAEVRISAVKGLGASKDSLAVEPLIDALRDPSYEVRQFAMWSLRDLGDNRAVQPLIAALDDPEFDVRRTAIQCLGEFGDDRAVPKLIAALRAHELSIRGDAAKSLGQIGNPEAVEPLIAVLESTEGANFANSPQERAAEALGRVGDVRAVTPLVAALNHSAPSVRRCAAEALEEIGTSEAQADDGIASQDTIKAEPKESRPREQSFSLAMLEWCDIPGTTLRYGERTFHVQPFKMAKYPVTYAQFQAFIDADDGFHNDEWWEGLAVRHDEPGRQSRPIDIHPRENVSWYDAVAFCRWLSARLGFNVRLPTEWERQWAAQGGDGREYPWGNEFDSSKCNTNASNIKRTTPVDQYASGVSPFGVCDMSGNVFEWCLNEYNPPWNTGLGGNAYRALRGGSFIFHTRSARVAFRDANDPHVRAESFGFRVVAAEPV